MSFSTKLKELRKERHILQKDLANKTGIGRTALSMYETGKREPSFKTLKAIAEALDVDMNTLLDETTGIAEAEERDIEKDLEDMLFSMSTAAYGDGSELEDKEVFKAAIKAAMIQSKKLAKKKYTPRKYRKD